MKSITIAGGITRDAINRTTQDGDNVTSFSVAVSEGFGDKKRSLYFDCSLWGKRGPALSQYLTKGSRVAVSGDFSTREHDGKTYHFCCNGCRTKFAADPAKYLKPAAAPEPMPAGN